MLLSPPPPPYRQTCTDPPLGVLSGQLHLLLELLLLPLFLLLLSFAENPVLCGRSTHQAGICPKHIGALSYKPTTQPLSRQIAGSPDIDQSQPCALCSDQSENCAAAASWRWPGTTNQRAHTCRPYPPFSPCKHHMSFIKLYSPKFLVEAWYYKFFSAASQALSQALGTEGPLTGTGDITRVARKLKWSCKRKYVGWDQLVNYIFFLFPIDKWMVSSVSHSSLVMFLPLM